MKNSILLPYIISNYGNSIFNLFSNMLVELSISLKTSMKKYVDKFGYFMKKDRCFNSHT